MYKPNLNVPLANSYNERGVAGFTHTQTNSEDQRKINCFYEVTKNALTGQGKLTLTKRPGVTINASTFGASTQAAYAISTDFLSGLTKQAFLSNPIIYSVASATAIKANNTTIYSISSGQAWVPIFVDRTIISNVENIVVQIRLSLFYPPTQKTFFCAASLGAGFTEITDPDFALGTGLRTMGKMEHMDGFAFSITQDNKIINSDLNTLSSWSATGFLTKQILLDVPVGLAKFSNQLLAFGENTVESYYNAGNATGSPLLPIKQLSQRVGMVQPTVSSGSNYAVTMNNKLFFLGRRQGGGASVGLFSYNGSIYDKISSSYMDKILGDRVNAESYYGIFPFGFNGHAAIAISLTIATAATQRWLMYFQDWNDWFEWNSTVFGPINAGEFFLGVTPDQHRVYKFDSTDTWQDNGTNFTMQTQFKLPQDGHQRKRMAEFGVLADTARSSNQLLVEFSDDDYVSFQNIGNIDLQRDIKTLNRGGSYRQRAVRLSSTNALEARLHAFVARIE